MSSETWESHARVVCEHLNEKHRRWVVGWLSEMIGWSGTWQIAQATGIDPKTIRQGRLDLQQGIEGYPVDRVRRAGGGRPPLKKIGRDSGNGNDNSWPMIWVYLLRFAIILLVLPSGIRLSIVCLVRLAAIGPVILCEL